MITSDSLVLQHAGLHWEENRTAVVSDVTVVDQTVGIIIIIIAIILIIIAVAVVLKYCFLSYIYILGAQKHNSYLHF